MSSQSSSSGRNFSHVEVVLLTGKKVQLEIPRAQFSVLAIKERLTAHIPNITATEIVLSSNPNICDTPKDLQNAIYRTNNTLYVLPAKQRRDSKMSQQTTNALPNKPPRPNVPIPLNRNNSTSPNNTPGVRTRSPRVMSQERGKDFNPLQFATVNAVSNSSKSPRHAQSSTPLKATPSSAPATQRSFPVQKREAGRPVDGGGLPRAGEGSVNHLPPVPPRPLRRMTIQRRMTRPQTMKEIPVFLDPTLTDFRMVSVSWPATVIQLANETRKTLFDVDTTGFRLMEVDGEGDSAKERVLELSADVDEKFVHSEEQKEHPEGKHLLFRQPGARTERVEKRRPRSIFTIRQGKSKIRASLSNVSDDSNSGDEITAKLPQSSSGEIDVSSEGMDITEIMAPRRNKHRSISGLTMDEDLNRLLDTVKEEDKKRDISPSSSSTLSGARHAQQKSKGSALRTSQTFSSSPLSASPTGGSSLFDSMARRKLKSGVTTSGLDVTSTSCSNEAPAIGSKIKPETRSARAATRFKMPPIAEKSFQDITVDIMSSGRATIQLRCSPSSTCESLRESAISELSSMLEKLKQGSIAVVENDGKQIALSSQEQLQDVPSLHRALTEGKGNPELWVVGAGDLPRLSKAPDKEKNRVLPRVGDLRNLPQNRPISRITPAEERDRRIWIDQIVGNSHARRECDLRDFNKDDELRMFRGKYYHGTDLAIPVNDRMEMQFTPVSQRVFPAYLPQQFILTVFRSDKTKSKLNCHAMKPVSCVIEQVIQHLKKTQQVGIGKDYLLRVPHRTVFLPSDAALGSVTYVQDLLQRKQAIELCLEEKSHVLQSFTERPWRQEYNPPSEDLQVDLLAANTLPTPRDLPSIHNMEHNFQVRVTSAEGLSTFFPNYGADDRYFVELTLAHGGEFLCETVETTALSSPQWDQWLQFVWPGGGQEEVKICNLPRATRLSFTLWGRKGSTRTPLGWTNCQLFDHRGLLRHGPLKLTLWLNDVANPIGTCALNVDQDKCILLNVELPEFPQPPYFPSYSEIFTKLEVDGSRRQRFDYDPRLDPILAKDSLHEMTDEEKLMVWNSREELWGHPKALPKILQSADWTDHYQLKQAVSLVASWGLLDPLEALELLDAKYAVLEIRLYAVNCLRKMCDRDLETYLLQLVQALKYESYHDSALFRFLLQRSLLNRPLIGHPFFWMLKAELHVAEYSERYGLILESYLRGCKGHLVHLWREKLMVDEFHKLASATKARKRDRRRVLVSFLSELQFPAEMCLPFDSNIQIESVVPEKCKLLDSFTLPIWLHLKVKNCPSPSLSSVPVIFKVGDDLRADVLTLQMVRLMDKLWQNDGLDLRLSCYSVVPTEREAGMIQVVPNAKTAAQIQKEHSGVTGAIKKTPLAAWLKEQNDNDEAYEFAVENFIHSLAGYCVATYILGIGDRHNDNIMITADGHLFHIDFAHFLGNVQKWQGFRRERAPFVLTPEFVYVMSKKKKDNKNFKRFVNLSCKAFNIIRRHAHHIITMFCLMLSTGIPELQCVEDIHYLRKVFILDKTDDEAAIAFQELINESLNTKATQVNFLIHNLAHPSA